MTAGRFLSLFSPEIDPGNATYSVENTAKIIGGLTEEANEPRPSTIHSFHRYIESPLQTLQRWSLLENTFRAVNIGLVTKWRRCHKLEVNTGSHKKAATKPFALP